jgi:hypothetical protein
MRDEERRPIDRFSPLSQAIDALRYRGVQTLEETLDGSGVSLLPLPRFGPAFLVTNHPLAAQVTIMEH